MKIEGAEYITEKEFRILTGTPPAKEMTSTHVSELHTIAETMFWNKRSVPSARGEVWRYARDNQLDVDLCEAVYDQHIRAIAYIPTIGAK